MGVVLILRYAYASTAWTPARGERFAAAYGGPAEPRLDARPIVDAVGEALTSVYFELVTDPAVQPRVALELIYDPNVSDTLGETERMRGLAYEFLDRARDTGAFQLIDAIADADAYRRPPEPRPIYAWELPDVGRARHIARLNRVRMFDAAAKGDWVEFARAYESSLALSRLMLLRGTSIEAMLGCAVLDQADGELRCTLMEQKIPDGVLADLQRRRARQHAGRFEAKAVVEGERTQVLDMLDATHTRGGTLLLSEFVAIGQQRDLFGIPAEHVHWFNVVGLLFPDRNECVAAEEQLFSPFQTIDLPAAERDNEQELLDETLELVPRHMPVLAVGCPPLDRVVGAVDRARTYSAGTDLMLALARFRVCEGEYPTSIEALGPEATDPITGRRFGYRLLGPGEDPFGRPYLLYSFGRDRHDDGGNAPTFKYRDAQLFGDRSEPGEDAIINRARAER